MSSSPLSSLSGSPAGSVHSEPAPASKTRKRRGSFSDAVGKVFGKKKEKADGPPKTRGRSNSWSKVKRVFSKKDGKSPRGEERPKGFGITDPEKTMAAVFGEKKQEDQTPLLESTLESLEGDDFKTRSSRAEQPASPPTEKKQSDLAGDNVETRPSRAEEDGKGKKKKKKKGKVKQPASTPDPEPRRPSSPGTSALERVLEENGVRRKKTSLCSCFGTTPEKEPLVPKDRKNKKWFDCFG